MPSCRLVASPLVSVGTYSSNQCPQHAFSATAFELSAMHCWCIVRTDSEIKRIKNSCRLPESVAVTLTAMAPASPSEGVPLNVRVEALKLSQDGNALPFDKVAE